MRNSTIEPYLSIEYFLSCICCSGALLLFAGPSRAAEVTRNNKISTKLCGVYCLHAVMQLYSIENDIKDMVKPMYIGSDKGSSFAELQAAAEDHGMYARPIRRLRCQQLKNSQRLPGPLILHVRSKVGGLYDHFLLFFGDVEGKARIFNPPDPVQLVDYAKLATLWDGTALIVSDHPIRSRAFLFPIWLHYAGMGGICILAVVTIRWIQKHAIRVRSALTYRKRFYIYAIQSVIISSLAIVLAVTYHLYQPEGFLTRNNAVAAIKRASLAKFIPKISLRKLNRMLNQGKCVLVDARFTRDYNTGHFDGAINIPVDANEVYISNTVEPIPKTKPLIVYCQSSTCPFANLIAEELVMKGFLNVHIFKGGWNEWVSAN